MSATPLPRPVAHLRIAKSWDGGAIVLTCSPSHEKAKPVFVLEDLQAYATQARADLEAENARLREALRNLLNDTQHAEHPDCDDGPCPVREARAALKDEK